MVLFTVGPTRYDPPCVDRNVSLPHASVGATPRNSERIFFAGNERTLGLMPEWGTKDAGYKLHKEDSLALLVELMNMTPKDEILYMTVTYDIIEGHPFKDDIKPLWLDVRQCGTSEINPPIGKSKYVKNHEPSL